MYKISLIILATVLFSCQETSKESTKTVNKKHPKLVVGVVVDHGII